MNEGGCVRVCECMCLCVCGLSSPRPIHDPKKQCEKDKSTLGLLVIIALWMDDGVSKKNLYSS